MFCPGSPFWLEQSLGGPSAAKHTRAEARKHTVTVANMATQKALVCTRDHTKNTVYPANSQAYHTVARTPSGARGATFRRANPAVSHWNTMVRANGFQVCVANSASSAQR